jgi:hypothetical protein
MAKRAGLTLAKAAELRFELLVKQADEDGLSPEEDSEKEKFVLKLSEPAGETGSPERAAWFEELVEEMQSNPGDGGGGEGGAAGALSQLGGLGGLMGAAGGAGGGNQQQMMQMLMGMMREQQGGGGKAGEAPDDGRRVLVSDLGALQASVDAHPALKWDERMER